MARSPFLLLTLAATACGSASTSDATATTTGDESTRASARSLVTDSESADAGDVAHRHFTQVAAGAYSACAVSRHHALWCWGGNEDGELANGTFVDSRTPVRVPGARDWVEASLGYTHDCALQENGSLWCWGNNQLGQVGSGVNQDYFLAPNEVPARKKWVQFASGGYQTCGIQEDASLWCWGSNGIGQIGYTIKEPQLSPVQVEVGTKWLEVKSGGEFTCALSVDHAMTCFGDDSFGQLGDGGAAGSAGGSHVVDGKWADFFLGDGHVCALKNDGGLFCWGRNDYGQLGDGSQTNALSPERIGSHKWTELMNGGGYDSCARDEDGQVSCWGKNVDGEAGLGSSATFVPTPTVVKHPKDWALISENVFVSAGIDADGRLFHWGVDSDYAALGTGVVVPFSASPERVLF